MQSAYEVRIQTLQRAVDRAATDRTAFRGAVESRLEALAERQAVIERREGQLAGLPGQRRESLPDPAAGTVEAEVPPVGRSLKPFPTPEMPALRTRGDDRAEILDIVERITRVERAAERVGAAQVHRVTTATSRAGRSAARFRDLILRAGLNPARFEAVPAGVGGPLVPIAGDAFEIALADAHRRREEEIQLRRVVAALPVRAPLAGEIGLSSGFGARLDPFTRGFALHTGLDMRTQAGTPARATAAGRVTAAEYSGGYGNMVEIDHGQGLVTRYAHLQGFAVAPGQTVPAGAVVGFVGSTGRSTGSHLHYETRIDGEPVDPQRFLRVGAELEFPE